MSPLLRKAIESRRLRRCLTAAAGPYAAVFTLHRPRPEDRMFNGVSEALLRECLEYARNSGYEFVSIDELVRRATSGADASNPMLCLTLDDGYADQLTRLVPILLEYDAKPTLFVISDFADDQDWPWDAQLAYAVKCCEAPSLRLTLGQRPREFGLSGRSDRIFCRRAVVHHAKTLSAPQLSDFIRYIASACEVDIPSRAPEGYRPATWPMLREWEKKGLTVGSHNRSHHLLTALEPERVGAELRYSWERLSSELTAPSKTFCYPSGTARDFSTTHESLVRSAGYQAGVTTLSRIAYFRDVRRNPYRISRIGFPDTVSQFARYASWVEALRSKLPL
ncbi:polysaccharide deacetylase family protein [Marinimicrobium locisalis]|uniref:polysaccharide deacetylase family protein n=1 Tax=Marinimicrobium locisalis TaxID=546022 RepID=UPI003221A5DB